MSFFSFQDIISCITGLFILMTIILALELINRKPIPVPSYDKLAEDITRAQARLEQLRQTIDSNRTQIAQINVGRVVTRADLDELRAKHDKSKRDKANATGDVGRLQVEVYRLRNATDGLKNDNQELDNDLDKLKRKIRIAQAVPPDDQGRQPVLVECGIGRVAVWRIDEGEVKETFTCTGTKAANEFLAWATKRPKDRERFFIVFRPTGAIYYQQIVTTLLGLNFKLGFDMYPEDLAFFDRRD